MKTIRCFLKKDKEKPLLGHHPWVFSGAIDRIDDDYQTGNLVKVFSADEKFLGIGYLNPRSQIAIRMLAFEDITINESFFEKKIRQAIAFRQQFIASSDTTAYRLIHAEGDSLPGLIVDRYADYLVVQILTAGMEAWRSQVVEILSKEFPAKGIFEKGDLESRDLEGLEKRIGKLAGEEPPDFVKVQENGNRFVVDIHNGQKTGFFLDQRESRRKVQSLSHGRRVLNCFSYTGGFSVYAAKGGAEETVSVDSSAPALNTARLNFEENEIDLEKHQFVEEDVFSYLRDSRQEFDFVILDPPAFCKGKQHIQQAARGYKEINLQALKKIDSGGLFFTFSCSHHISPDLFQKILFGAAKDANRSVRILSKTAHPMDHPINIYHPEGEYLKGLLCQVS